jgi:lipid-A-disaccharide synthase
MGFTEVIMNLRTIFKNIDFCKTDINNYKPDAVILVDYPGFNLRIAEFIKGIGLPVYYYISPQVWAWKSSRVKKIKRMVDKMFVILPFEKDFYKKFGYEVEYVGHPLTDVIERKRKSFSDRNGFLKKYGLENKPIIAMLPGSRKQEIETMLPLMLSVKSSFPEFNFVIAGAPAQPEELYHKYCDDRTRIIFDNTYELLFHSQAALVTSGTATLEAALLNVPEVVCYKGGQISYYIARSLVRIKFISLVNLIMDKEVVKELIQSDLNSDTLSSELKNILDPVVRQSIMADYKALQEKLSEGGAASKTAMLILEDLTKRKN